MYARFMLIAAASLTSASAYAAEPAKPPVQQAPQQPHSTPPQVVLASADVARPAATPTTEQHAPAQPRRRIARATTCRCGDQEGQPED